ncbi:MAG: preprotein translocase subunit SecG [Deferribacteraceae bacterium]|jgi:preprotein translocase subunit SecG|nr:preprotein translocase subunit SecG [Deferribacteraceae bacterium]
MYNIVLGLHVFVCILLIVAVLMQSGKGGGLGSTFGGGNSGGNMFGPGAPANFMQKATTVIATCFLLLSLVLALMASNRNTDSLLRGYQAPQAPAATEQAE